MIPVGVDIMSEKFNLDGRHVDALNNTIPYAELEDIDYRYTHWQYWVYCLTSMPVAVMLGMINLFFIKSAAVMYERRRFLQQHLSAMLEYNVYMKPAFAAYAPNINFIDPTSLIAWLNMRTIVQYAGLRYQTRMNFYMAVYIVLIALNYLYVVCYAFDYVPPNIKISLPLLFSSQCYFLNAGIVVMTLLNHAAYLNDETTGQIVNLNLIRGMLHEIVEFKELYLEYYFPEADDVFKPAEKDETKEDVDQVNE